VIREDRALYKDLFRYLAKFKWETMKYGTSIIILEMIHVF
jgi:hypothetical protein